MLMHNPVLMDLPDSLTSERLILRVPRPGDGPVVHAAIAQSLPELRRFLAAVPWVAGEQSVAASELFCRQARANFLARTDMPYLMFDRATGDFVGTTGLHRPVWATPKFEVGYWCQSALTGQGFVSEAVRALSAYALAHLSAARLELVTDQDNVASRRVAERSGFTLECISRNAARGPDGRLRHLCLYARTPQDEHLP